MPIGTYTTPPLTNHYTKNVFNFLFFFHFRCILLQISHKKCFFYKYFYTQAFGVKLDSIDRAITRKLIEHLKNKTSTGVNDISSKLLKFL